MKDNKNVFIEEVILKSFEYERLKNNKIKVKYYPINIADNQEANLNSLRWLVRHMV